MNKATCSYCAPRVTKKPKKPEKNKAATIHGAAAATKPKLKELGYVVINTTRGKGHPSFLAIDQSTVTVHVHGHLFVWALEEILGRANNLEKIQLVPTGLTRITDTQRQLCAKRGVLLTTGYHRPELKWTAGEVRSPFYQTQQTFMRELENEQRKLFDELMLFGFESAEITSRYFCLQGEDYIPQRELAAEYGIKENNNHAISAKIGAVLLYLDPTFETGAISQRIASTIKRRVERVRASLQISQDDTDDQAARRALEMRDKFERTYGFPLASNFPLVRLEIYEALLAAQKDGRLEMLQEKNNLGWQVLVLRFGLVGPRSYRTLHEISKHEGIGVTTEAVRQREVRALRLLGLQTSSNESADELADDEL